MKIKVVRLHILEDPNSSGHFNKIVRVPALRPIQYTHQVAREGCARQAFLEVEPPDGPGWGAEWDEARFQSPIVESQRGEDED